MGLLKHTAASQGTGPSFPLLSHKPAQAQLTSSLPARPSPTMLSNHAPTRGSCQCLSQRGRTPGHWQMRTPKHIEIPVQSCQGAASVNSLRSQGESPESLRAGGFPCPGGPGIPLFRPQANPSQCPLCASLCDRCPGNRPKAKGLSAARRERSHSGGLSRS